MKAKPDNIGVGKIITFYSYKGGVGRSMILANVATLLAKMGKKVLCIDFDLEAPGLDRYYSKFIKNELLGVIDLIHNIKEIPWHTDNTTDSFNINFETSFDQYLTEITFPDNIQLNIITSGKNRAKTNYNSRIQSIDWDDLYDNHHLGYKIEAFRNFLKNRFDYIFIDSRTGISDIGGICTIQFPDILSIVFTPNHQSLHGAIEIAEHAKQARNAMPTSRAGLPIVPIISRFDPTSEKIMMDSWIEIIRNKIQDSKLLDGQM